MSITLDLPQELETELSAEATRPGLSLPEYVLRVLSTGFVIGDRPKSGAEMVEHWQDQGLIASQPDIADSQTHARQIRERAERRTRT